MTGIAWVSAAAHAQGGLLDALKSPTGPASQNAAKAGGAAKTPLAAEAAAMAPGTDVSSRSRVNVQRPPQADAKPVPGVVLRFENADVQDIVQSVLGDILHVNYMMDPSIQARVTLQSAGDISAADVYNILESVLALHGIAIVRDGKVYKVIRDAQANRDAPTVAAGENSPLVQVVSLRFVQASGLVGPLRTVLGAQALIANDPTNRYLIAVDRAQNIAKMLELIDILDVDYLAKVRIKLVEVRSEDATQLSKEMEALFRTSGLYNLPGTDGNKVYFLPVTRMNAILVAATNEEVLVAAEKWIHTLDEAPKNGLSSRVHIYPAMNATAAHLADLLRQVYGGAPSAPATPAAGTPGAPANAPTQVVLRGAQGGTLEGNVQIIVDDNTNSLVIRSSQQDYQQIRMILARIDTVPKQVLIQVMVAEIGLSENLQFGVEWWLKNLRFRAGNTDSSAQASLTSGLVAPTGNPITSATGGSGLNYLIFNSAGDITGLFNLLASNTDVNILSAPHILASDGKTAKIEVGSEEPVVTQTTSTPLSTSGVTTSNSVQYRPTGILMEVKPSITASGRVSLSLVQEVSARGVDVTVGGTSYPSFSKRKVSTDVTIEEGKSLIVAGLIQDRGDFNNQGLPGLKDIPLLGGLFGSQKRTSAKTELLIAITPFIVRNSEEGDRITANFRDSLEGLKKQMGAQKIMKGSLEPSRGEPIRE
ncbi:MAG: type II secretion system secretin GspD [Proteobacteria bacterium]|nr:type II secretion system secretin GspD [Pseudomonadota bacterium]